MHIGAKYVQCMYVTNMYSIRMMKFVKGKRRKIAFKNLKNRRNSWIGHIIKRNEFAVNVLEGAISGKKAVGRPGLQCLKQASRQRHSSWQLYSNGKRVACNSCRWKAANQSKSLRIRRRCTVYVGVGAKLCTSYLYFNCFHYVLTVKANKIHCFSTLFW